ncbi:hemolysin family protein [Desulfoferrobacter suflitae]|uniref:hemolysin family protein n=1 Tax=Desulfoferrobacter suflitae TaxID=2865782 RepID=UPI00216434D3|nr:hemolysin family protein [Desulfoferrobacter suflitae]MCK8601531.1 hemolysin family protein [Desulfoferrobacter suflitae]
MYLEYLEILVILLLIIANGFFSMSEIAVISARKARLQQWSEEGNEKAQEALLIAKDPNSFLSTIQIGITLIGVLTGALGGVTVAHRLSSLLAHLPYVGEYAQSVAIGTVVVAVTYLSLVIGELAPKRLALNSPERIASLVAKPMRTLAVVATPAIRLLSLSTEVVLKLLRVRPSNEPPITEEEFKVLMEQGTLAGVFHETEQKMMERVLRLGDRRAGALMTPRKRVVWLDIKDSTEKTRRKIAKHPHSRFPVCQKRLGNVLGFVEVKDLLVRMLAGHAFSLEDVLQRPVFVHEATHAFEVVELLKNTGNQMALVVDEYGTIEGLLTLSDLLQALIGKFPESGSGESTTVCRADGSCMLEGTVPIDEFKDLFSVKSLPNEESDQFETLGGFIMKYLGRIPAEGERFECCGLDFVVEAMDGLRVGKVLVRALQERKPEV